jgi:hypothetical protein
MMVGTVMFCGIVAVVIHELSHAMTYWIAGYSAWISFQRVHPDAGIPASYEIFANAIGPLGTWLAAALFFQIAVRRKTFFSRTMAFSNVTLRIVPTILAIVRGFQHAEHGFSDEGVVVFALVHSTPGRLACLFAILSVSFVGTWIVSGCYGLSGRRKLWLFPIFVVSYSMMFMAFLLDQWFGFSNS